VSDIPAGDGKIANLFYVGFGFFSTLSLFFLILIVVLILLSKPHVER